MCRLRNLIKYSKDALIEEYNSFNSSLFTAYRLSAAGPDLNDNPPIYDGVCLMSMRKREHHKRIRNGVSLPGYDPKKTSLKKFIKENYILSKNELCRVLKDLGGNKKHEAMKLLKKRRKLT